MKIVNLTFFILQIVFVLSIQNTFAGNPNNYPYNNPLITNMYTADASPHVMPDGRVYMVTSIDHRDGGNYPTMHEYHIFSSANMTDWVDHGEVLNITDFDEPGGEDWALWAPDLAYYKGVYYLYFPIRIKKANGSTQSYIALAESPRLDKRFTVTKYKMAGTSGIDPSIFIDDDGERYLYWGSKKVAKLKENMREIDGGVNTMDIGANNYMEAPWMHKRNGKYYFNYHTHYNGGIDKNNPNDPNREKSQIDYSWGNSPTGPFTYGGVMNYELGYNTVGGPKLPGYDYVPWRLTQSNHGGLVEYHGTEYFFYHTSALSSWIESDFQNKGVWTKRSTCVDTLGYNPDGTVIPVVQTVASVNEVNISQPYAINLDLATAEQNNVTISSGVLEFNSSIAWVKFDNINLGTGYYYCGWEAIESPANCKIEFRLNAPDGKLCGTITINSNSNEINEGIMETLLREANGVQNVYFVFKQSGNHTFKFNKPRIFAGAPQKVSPSVWITSPIRGSRLEYNQDFTINIKEQIFGDVSIYDSVQLYLNNNLINTKYSAPYTWKRADYKTFTNLTAGEYNIKVIAWQNGIEDTDMVNIYQKEFTNTLIIEAEDYSDMEGVQKQASSDNEDVENGEQLAFIQSGDWAEYKVNIPNTANYKISYRLASNEDNCSIMLKEDGNTLTTTSFGKTGGWKSYVYTEQQTVAMEKGEHTFKLEFLHPSSTGYLFNLNKIIFEAPVNSINESSTNQTYPFSIYPNPAKNYITVKANGVAPAQCAIYTLKGELIKTYNIDNNTFKINLTELNKGVYLVNLRNHQISETKKIILK